MSDAEERHYLARVLARIHQQQAGEGEGARRAGEELANLRRWWTDEATREATQFLDRAQNLPLLEGLEAEAAHRARRLRQLSLESRHPYFGRVDFREDSPSADAGPETFYVGLGGVWDETGHTLVVDWRTPVAGLYYDAEPGRAQFTGPDGAVVGDVMLKRQYRIEHGALVGFFDTVLHIGDELLSRAMAMRGGARMPSIVATIQREQNLAIRDVRHSALTVTGPAGSGKTAVALQRLAYLLYHRPGLHAADILFLVPTRVFADYVSDVLPELGEENPRYATWEDLVVPWFPVQPFERRASLLEEWFLGRVARVRRCSVEVKGRPEFVAVLDEMMAGLADSPPPFRTLRWEGVVVAGAEEMARWWRDDFGSRPVFSRLGLIVDRLEEKVDRLVRQVTARVRADLVDSQTMPGDDSLRRAVQRRVAEGQRRIAAEVAEGGMIDWRALYRRLYEDGAALLVPLIGSRAAAEVAEDAAVRLAAGPWPFEDVPPLAYVRATLLRPRLPWRVRLAMIEEAHELTPCQTALLSRLLPDVPVTVVGDVAQALVPGLSCGVDLALPRWASREMGTVRLTKSYRSTPAIAALLRALRDGPKDLLGETVAWRAGEPIWAPEVEQVLPTALLGAVADKVRQAPSAGTVGVICASAVKAAAVTAALQRALSRPVSAVVDPNGAFPGGVMVLPVWMAAGLEFDTVVVVDPGELERQALYVAASRARHRLHLISAAPMPAWFPPESVWRERAGSGIR
jgi:DNA helicase-2/ATP-dependent DNA helicase PcrA